MTALVALRPGHVTLAEWRAIYRGAAVELDPVFQPDVEAGAAALQAIGVKAGSPSEANAAAGSGTADVGSAEAAATLERERVSSLSHACADGNSLPFATIRLIAALKLAALGRGVLGARWRLVEHFGECVSLGLLPPVPADGDEPAMLARLAAGLLGEGELIRNGEVLPAPEGLASAGLVPPALAATECDALTSGTQVSTALALAGLFEAERLLQTALIGGALSGAVLRPCETVRPPPHARLWPREGALASAAALRALRPAEPMESSRHAESTQASGLFREARAMGVCLDLLRQAGEKLAAEANAVTEDRLVFWQTHETVENPPLAGDAVAVAVDLVAMGLARLGGLSERRTGLIFEAAHAMPGSNSEARNGSAIASLRPTAASLARDVRERAFPSILDGEPDDETQPAVSSALSSARRLQPIAGNLTLILAIELIAAAGALEADRPGESGPLARVRDLLRSRTAKDGGDPLAAPQLAAVADLVRSGAVAAASGIELPSVVGFSDGAAHLCGCGKAP